MANRVKRLSPVSNLTRYASSILVLQHDVTLKIFYLMQQATTTHMLQDRAQTLATEVQRLRREPRVAGLT